jgi:hypothetical protein
LARVTKLNESGARQAFRAEEWAPAGSGPAGMRHRVE